MSKVGERETTAECRLVGRCSYVSSGVDHGGAARAAMVGIIRAGLGC